MSDETTATTKPRVVLDNATDCGQFLTGFCTGHPLLDDGEYIHTSRIVARSGSIVETRNTIYFTDLPYEEESEDE